MLRKPLPTTAGPANDESAFHVRYEALLENIFDFDDEGKGTFKHMTVEESTDLYMQIAQLLYDFQDTLSETEEYQALWELKSNFVQHCAILKEQGQASVEAKVCPACRKTIRP